MTPRLTVAVMAFNEVENLEPAVRELHAALAALNGAASHDLLIIDDGSNDGTGALADRLAAELPRVRVIHHDVNRGIGGAYRSGFAEVRGDLLTFFPADGQFPASILQTFHPLMADHDLVLGTLPGRDRSLVAKALSGMEQLLYRILFGKMHRFQGIFMIRRDVLAELDLQISGRGWGVVMEMILKASRSGCRVVSVPTELRPRRSGQSKVNNWRTILTNLKQAFELYRILRSSRA